MQTLLALPEIAIACLLSNKHSNPFSSFFFVFLYHMITSISKCNLHDSLLPNPVLNQVGSLIRDRPHSPAISQQWNRLLSPVSSLLWFHPVVPRHNLRNSHSRIHQRCRALSQASSHHRPLLLGPALSRANNPVNVLLVNLSRVLLVSRPSNLPSNHRCILRGCLALSPLSSPPCIQRHVHRINLVNSLLCVHPVVPRRNLRNSPSHILQRSRALSQA